MLTCSKPRSQTDCLPQATGTPNSGNPAFACFKAPSRNMRTRGQIQPFNKTHQYFPRLHAPNQTTAILVYFQLRPPFRVRGQGGGRYLFAYTMRHQLTRLCTSQTAAARHRCGLPEKISSMHIAQRDERDKISWTGRCECSVHASQWHAPCRKRNAQLVSH
jgi:hypothetical protein